MKVSANEDMLERISARHAACDFQVLFITLDQQAKGCRFEVLQKSAFAAGKREFRSRDGKDCVSSARHCQPDVGPLTSKYDATLAICPEGFTDVALDDACQCVATFDGATRY